MINQHSAMNHWIRQDSSDISDNFFRGRNATFRLLCCLSTLLMFLAAHASKRQLMVLAYSPIVMTAALHKHFFVEQWAIPTSTLIVVMCTILQKNPNSYFTLFIVFISCFVLIHFKYFFSTMIMCYLCNIYPELGMQIRLCSVHVLWWKLKK